VQHKIPCLCPVRLDLASRLNIEASHDDACFGTVTTLAPALGNTMTFNLEIELCLFLPCVLGAIFCLSSGTLFRQRGWRLLLHSLQ
jgi:hypothetical protein